MSLSLDELFPTITFDPAMRSESVPWLIEGIWQKGKINAMFAPEKSGKSRLLGWLLAAMNCGKAPLGLPCLPPSRTLYLAGEETVEDITARLVKYSSLMGAASDFAIDFINAAGMRLEQEKYRRWLSEKLPAYDLLVIDPMRRVHGADEDSNSEMAAFHNALRRWSNHNGLSIVLLHHTGKLNDEANMDRIATWSRGATDLAAIVDTASFVNRYSGDRIRLLRAGRFPPLDALEIVDGSDAKGFRLA